MRMILSVEIPNEPFNTLVRKGTVANLMKKILEATKPEAIYFTEQNGMRGAIAIVDVKDSTQIPSLAEPWYLSLNATCKFRIAMTPDDLGKTGIETIGKTW